MMVNLPPSPFNQKKKFVNKIFIYHIAQGSPIIVRPVGAFVDESFVALVRTTQYNTYLKT